MRTVGAKTAAGTSAGGAFRAPAESGWARTTVASTPTSHSPAPSPSQPTRSPSSTRTQVPSADHRWCRLYTVFQLPYEAGRSRHGVPVRVRHYTPSITIR